jgi:hypothetical protein
MVVGHFDWSFKLIHITLAVISLAFAVVTWRIATDSRRYTRAVEKERNARPDRMSATQLAAGAVRLGWRKRVGAGTRSTVAPQTAIPVATPSDPAD